MPTGEAWIVILGAIGAAGVVLGYVIKVSRFLYRLLINLSKVVEEWQGQPARDGEPERPSLPRRLTVVERDLKGMQVLLRELERRLDQVATATGAAPAPPSTGGNR